jgi:hypothetical protein
LVENRARIRLLKSAATDLMHTYPHKVENGEGELPKWLELASAVATLIETAESINH